MSSILKLHTPTRDLLFKLALFLILYTLYSILYTQSAFAQAPSTSPISPEYSYQASTTDPNRATKALYDFGHALNCILIGQSPIAPCLQYKTFVDAGGAARSIPVLSNADTSMGVLGFGQSVLVSLIETKPLSSSEFLAQMGSSIGIVDEAHAQVGGSGNSILSPVYKLWWVSRNIAYLAMIFIFLIVGFMVMFRQKLNPQTVVTIQLALPGLVIGLIMITFSYFIASLITDMAFVATDLVGYFFQSAQSGPNGNSSLSQLIGSQNSIAIMSRMTSAIGDFDISSGISSFLENLSGRPAWYVRIALGFLAYQYGGQATAAALTPVGAAIGFGIGAVGTGGIASLATAGAGATLAGVLSTIVGGAITSTAASLYPGPVFSFIISFIVVIMLIVTIFKLIYKLIQNFLSIIFYTIISPFVFLASSLPGRQGMVSDWVRNMLCNVLAFPAVIAVLYFCYYLLTNGQPLEGGGQAFLITKITPAPLTNNSSLPLLGGLDLGVLNMLLGFGAFLATPSIPDIVCKAIGKIGPAAGMIEGNITGAQRSAQGYSRQATGASGQISKDVGGFKQLADQKGVNLWGEYKVSAPGAWNYLKNWGSPKI